MTKLNLNRLISWRQSLGAVVKLQAHVLARVCSTTWWSIVKKTSCIKSVASQNQQNPTWTHWLQWGESEYRRRNTTVGISTNIKKFKDLTKCPQGRMWCKVRNLTRSVEPQTKHIYCIEKLAEEKQDDCRSNHKKIQWPEKISPKKHPETGLWPHKISMFQ